MKTLCLIRHAKSYPQEAPFTDFERRLTKQGEQDAHDMGLRLRQHHFMPDAIVTSPALRSRQTAEHIAGALNFPMERIQDQPSVYMASVAKLVTFIGSTDNCYDRIALIGHNPGMTELVNALTDVTLEHLPTCGMVLVEFPVLVWSDIAEKKGKVVHYDFPQRV